MRRVLAIGLVAWLVGCGGTPEVSSETDAAATVVAPAPSPRTPQPPATPGPTIAVPAGVVLAGSTPGTPFRRPSREVDEIPVELPAFAIDRHPYPNEPFAPPQLVTSRAEAAALCEARGARLCTELEWERACEGDAHDRFPGGRTYDADRCSRDRSACASALGAMRMGETAPEWTASDAAESLVRRGRSAVLRGAQADAPADQHRCDARVLEVPEAAPAAAFRCCHGTAPAVRYPEVDRPREVVDLTVERDAIRAALRGVPELAAYADDFEPYAEADGDRALACANVDRRALAGWELAPGPFAWSPSPGEATWVVAGRGGGSSLIAVLYVLPGDRFAHAASFVLEGEDAPIAVTRTPPSRGELQWSACWGRPGDGGVVRFGEDSIVRVISH
ncbi:formylglycine-generating enzyme family protein [Sandaracinus amylolyticus]|uniref:formylglycine-generating enzyme family protein n=1 Tax=Sandaracinus amylolyticus TaxID=927083 RepID=UPI001F340CB7|nr:hypothetical protein [Sandaracinus amylolyticus]UJR80901.1 FGE-sulfatase domain-containing protein [Sandaracinus amylolyticus]